MDYKMISLARTPEEIKKDSPMSIGEASPKYEGPKYPWGTSLRLEKETLDKLGMKDLPIVGDSFEICVKVRVTNVSMSENETGEGKVNESQCVELQVTDMGLPMVTAGDASIARSEKRQTSWYGSPDVDTGKEKAREAAE